MAMAVPSHPWRPAMCLSARACLGRLRLASRPAHLAAFLFLLARPAARVGERGAWASGFIARRGLPRAGGGVALCSSLLRFNEATKADEYVDCVNCRSSVDCARVIGYILNRALSRVR